MTLSQRLTRAGLVFVLLGTVAAALPQQNDSAKATTANGTTGYNKVRLTSDSSGGDPTTSASISRSGTNGAAKSVTLYTFISPNSGDTFKASGAAISITSGGSAAISTTATNSVDNSVTVTPTSGANIGINTIQATFGAGTSVDYTVSVAD